MTRDTFKANEVPVGVGLLCQVYADAYHHGHHATVEGGYIDVLPVDRGTFWHEQVEENYTEALVQQPVAVNEEWQEQLADALEYFWNAALGGVREYDDPTASAVMSGMVQGVNAVATRLREHAAQQGGGK